MPVAHLLIGPVEVLHVLLIDVRRGDVRPAPEPPDPSLGLEISVVEVHGGGVGVLRMHDRGEPACEEGHLLAGLVALAPVLAGKLATVVGGREGLLGHRAVDNREIATGLLKDLGWSGGEG